MLRDLALALSLSNLCHVVAWSRLIALARDPTAQYLRYNLSDYQAVLITCSLLAAVFWGAMTLVRRSGSARALGLAQSAFLLVLLIPFNGVLRTQFPELAPSPFESARGVFWLSLVPVGGSLVIRFRPTMVRVLGFVVLTLSPFALMTIAQTAWLMTKFEDGPAAAPLPTVASGPRILWLVFDEMDEGLAFERRPPTLRLPELDRLRAEALAAHNAYPPNQWTLRAMPSLLTGKLVARAEASNPSELSLTFQGSEESTPWSAEPNVFSRAREAGYNSALSGWYHPYCRVIGHTLTRCVNRDAQATLAVSVLDQIRSLVHTFPCVSRITGWQKPWRANLPAEARARYLAMLADATRWVTDPSLGLILVHWGFPHEPIIYDRRDGALEGSVRSNYLDNLALVDRTLRDLRGVMQRASVWDSTVVLVTSDHPFRPNFFHTEHPSWPAEENATLGGARDPQIPFILKLSEQTEGVRYDAPFNTVVTHDLLLALMRREVSTPVEVVSWLDRHRSIEQSPYE